MTNNDRILKAAIYTGNYNKRDGIGRAVREKVEALRTAEDGTWQVTVFCQESDMDDPDVRVCRGLSQVVNDPAFRNAHIHVFEGGWVYWLMEALLFVPPAAKTIVHYEGMTFPEFLTDLSGYLATWKQRLLFHKADLVLASSPHNKREMVDFGIDPSKLGILSLATTLMPRTPPLKRISGPVNLLQVGRLVPNKGTPDLIAALAMLPPEFRSRLHLKIVGSREAADRDYLARIDAAIEEHRLNDSVQFVGMVEDDRLSDLYGEADALLQPSYHEGFCLPVPEAYAHCCHVITYDNTNLPDVAGGLGRVVPTGDIAALSAAIADFVRALDSAGRADGSSLIDTDSGRKPWRRLQEDVRAYAARYSSAAFGPAFREVVRKLLQAPPSTGMSRLDPAIFFENRRTYMIKPADLTIKDAYDKPELAVRQNRSIEYRRERHGGIAEDLLFYGPYSELPAGRWQVQVEGDLDGECLLRLTRNCGTFMHEERLRPDLTAFEFEAVGDIEQFETILFLLPGTRAVSLRGIVLKRVD
jgi:glycosyltransferase involved in cell wall biosynthesis